MTPSDALALAISHIDHMAAWIGRQNNGYSFEALGEDMPNLLSVLEALRDTAPRPDREAIARIIATQLGEDYNRLVSDHFEPSFCQEDFLRSADAVIAALTEPAQEEKPEICPHCRKPVTECDRGGKGNCGVW